MDEGPPSEIYSIVRERAAAGEPESTEACRQIKADLFAEVFPD